MAGLDTFSMRSLQSSSSARDLASGRQGQGRQRSPDSGPGGLNHEYMPLLAAEQGEATPRLSPRNESHAGSYAQMMAAQAAMPRQSYDSGQQGFGGGPGGSSNGRAAALQPPEPPSSGPDIVQFTNMFFYIEEGAGKVAVTAMRIGSLKTLCSISFETEDNSATAGLKYQATKGSIEFKPGEEMKSIEIKILEDDSFDTNLDFLVVMHSPVGCQLGDNLHRTRVVIIDDDVFPTNFHREKILKEDTDAIGVRLLVAFIKFALQRIPLVDRRSWLTLIVDQFSNISYLIGIWLNVYLVDVVFAVHRPESNDELWIVGHRMWTLLLVAFCFLLPKAILAAIEHMKTGSLAVAGKVKLHLKVNLFRKYLYYNQAAHTKVSAQELTKAMEDDINELVTMGFMVIFQLAQQTVKVGVILFFLVRKRPSSALPLLIYPIAMALVLNLRYETTLKLKDVVRDAEKATMICLRESCDDIGLIKEYNMRTAVVNRYEKSIKDQGAPITAFGNYDFLTMLVMPWITNFAIALFMIVGGHYVLTDQLSLGAYLATIAIYRDAGDLFSDFYIHLKNGYGVIGPLLRVVRLLNLDTDVKGSMEQAEERAVGMLQELQAEERMRKQFSLSTRATSRFDMLHIKMVNSSLANDRGGPKAGALQDISVEVPQGKLVSILGPHGSGKFSLLKLLTGLVKPLNGRVLVPTHLRCLCVPNQPQIFRNGGLLENLTFGTKGEYDRNRLVKLCGAVGMAEHTMKVLEQEMKADREDVSGEKGTSTYLSTVEKGTVPWYEQLSQSELLKMHITRALNLNPEVLLLHRPVDEMEADHAARILDVLRQYVDHRGLFLTPHQRAASRPHTVFFTSGEDRERADSARDVSDVVWHVSDKGFSVEQGGRNPANSTLHDEQSGGRNNKIVSSWSREVRSLQVNLEKEKHLHSATMDELETHRSEVENLRGETEHLRGSLSDVHSQVKRAFRDSKSYESEMAAWEGENAKSSWLPCSGTRGVLPAPRAISENLASIIATGESGMDPRARASSPVPPYSAGRNSSR